MIARIKGRLVKKAADYIVVDAAGVGYKVFVTAVVADRIGPLGDEVVLEIHTQVKEDAIQLYGFLDDVEQEAFEALISMNGVGPRMAMGVLSGIEARELAVAVCSGDLARLCLVPGIGKKKAERMVVHLKDRLLPLAQARMEGDAGASSTMDDLRSALSNLGFKGLEVERVAGILREKVVAGSTLEVLLPEALKLIRG
jgi:holliday junction DNA helicase RuvA